MKALDASQASIKFEEWCVAVVPAVRVVESGDSSAPGVDVLAVFDREAMRYRASAIKVTAPDGSEVTGTQLRGVRVTDYLRCAGLSGVYLEWNGERLLPLSRFGDDLGAMFNQRISAGIRRAGPTSDNLFLVALSYFVAQISSQPPAKAVERDLGLPARTAANWIARAKEEGILFTGNGLGGEDADQ